MRVRRRRLLVALGVACVLGGVRAVAEEADRGRTVLAALEAATNDAERMAAYGVALRFPRSPTERMLEPTDVDAQTLARIGTHAARDLTSANPELRRRAAQLVLSFATAWPGHREEIAGVLLGLDLAEGETARLLMESLARMEPVACETARALYERFAHQSRTSHPAAQLLVHACGQVGIDTLLREIDDGKLDTAGTAAWWTLGLSDLEERDQALLLRFLASEDSGLRSLAAGKLSKFEDALEDPAVARLVHDAAVAFCLRDESFRMRQCGARLCARARIAVTPETLRTIAAMSLSDPKDKVRESCAAAVRDIGPTEDVRSALEMGLESHVSAVRWSCAGALRKLGAGPSRSALERCLRWEESEPVVEEIRAALREFEYAQDR
jgi:hypothetical protein